MFGVRLFDGILYQIEWLKKVTDLNQSAAIFHIFSLPKGILRAILCITRF
jgi:hypothetical protein